uniref:Uncharacterized protein B1642C07.40 n=1 Tax=Oryza sativa subsp. japonica TaxID=39947 RepID=Q5F1Y1_ORYSJ|nr:hypothetical protein [Oryza sativa Japonica Group]
MKEMRVTKDDTDYAPADEIGLSQLADAPEATKPSQSPRQRREELRSRSSRTHRGQKAIWRTRRKRKVRLHFRIGHNLELDGYHE